MLLEGICVKSVKKSVKNKSLPNSAQGFKYILDQCIKKENSGPSWAYSLWSYTILTRPSLNNMVIACRDNVIKYKVQKQKTISILVLSSQQRLKTNRIIIF